jgi:hypothetical protein
VNFLVMYVNSAAFVAMSVCKCFAVTFKNVFFYMKILLSLYLG